MRSEIPVCRITQVSDCVCLRVLILYLVVYRARFQSTIFVVHLHHTQVKLFRLKFESPAIVNLAFPGHLSWSSTKFVFFIKFCHLVIGEQFTFGTNFNQICSQSILRVKGFHVCWNENLCPVPGGNKKYVHVVGIWIGVCFKSSKEPRNLKLVWSISHVLKILIIPWPPV